MVFYCKTDCSNAFCLVPVLVSQCGFLTMMAVHPKSGVKYFFVDKCLLFGSSWSCAIFQSLTKSLALTNYLDDFLFMALRLLQCEEMLSTFLQLCKDIGCPISDDKTKWGVELMVFLRMLLDGKCHIIMVPADKVTKATNYLCFFIENRKVIVKFVQQLTGILNFLNQGFLDSGRYLHQ